jgi:adenylate cyclase
MTQDRSSKPEFHSSMSRKARFFWALAVGLGIMLAFLWLGATEHLGMAIYDSQMRAHAAPAKQSAMPVGGGVQSTGHGKIALVMIDQSSLDWVQKELGLGWPWPRELYGVLAEYLRDAEAQAYDILFTEPSTFGPEDDAKCAQAMTEAGNVVLATLASKKPVLDVPNALPGHVAAVVDSDGICRKYQAWLSQNDGKLLSLGLAAVSKSSNLTELTPLLPADGTVLLKFGSPARFERYSAAQIIAAAMNNMQGKAKSSAAEKASSQPSPQIDFSGKVVVVGLSAPGLLDRQAAPIDPALPGMEIHATFIDNMFNHTFMQRTPIWLEMLVGALGAALVAFAPMVHKRVIAVLAAILAVGTPIMLCLALFGNLVFFNPVSALVAAFAALVAAIGLGYQAEGRQKAYLRRAFAQYLSPEVISSLVDQPQTLQLGGELKTITTLFTDMVGFTSVSEKLNPSQLAAFMNEYLGIISEEILAMGGTLDKYVGDAVVAFWNAPLSVDDHAYRALATAVRIQTRLGAASKELEQRYGIAPQTRIGVATGKAIVGNLGSNRRFAYTAVGDSVNIASRLEAANKAIGTSILTMRDTVLCAIRNAELSSSMGNDIALGLPDGEAMRVRRLGLASVEGKEQPVEVWSVEHSRRSVSVEPWDGVRRMPK